MICRGVSYQKAADTVGVSQSSIARMLAFLGHPCGGVISKIKDFDNAPKLRFIGEIAVIIFWLHQTRELSEGGKKENIWLDAILSKSIISVVSDGSFCKDTKERKNLF